jgi:hypothetical protein
MFNSNIHNKQTDYHVFAADDLALEAIGMCIYTSGSMLNYLNNANTDIREYFGGDLNTPKSQLLGIGPLHDEISILYFDKDDKKYRLISGLDVLKNSTGTQVFNNLGELLQKHNDIELGIATPTDDEKEVIKDIQISKSGCITFRPNFNVLGCQRMPLIRLSLNTRKNNDTSRVVAQHGSPLIAAVPTSAVNMEYSFHDSNQLPTGQYSEPQQGGASNASNAITANLKLSYNAALGKFESGTQQTLARLLTDVDAAKITEIPNIDTIIDSADPSDLYDPESPNYMGQFQTGLAIPLSIENGNPFMFGPDMMGCDGSKKIKIKVVNRSPRAFKKGDVVLCSQIGPEWIIQGFDTPQIQKSTAIKLGAWTFKKWLANSDVFFRDARFVSDVSNSLYNSLYNVDVYSAKFRKRYYRQLFSGGGDAAGASINDPNILALSELNDMLKLSKLNLYEKDNDEPYDDTDGFLSQTVPFPEAREYDIAPAAYYEQCIFDQLGQHMFGKNTANAISRTNFYKAISIDTENNFAGDAYMDDLAAFWGPTFPDGYNSQQTSKFKTKTRNLDINASGYNSIYFGGSSNQDTSEILSISAGTNARVPPYMFQDEADGNLSQLPAEAALNGKSSPIELSFYYGRYKEKNLVDECESFMTSSSRYNWLSDTSGNDIYGLTPIQSNRIQFSPLQLEMVVSEYQPLDPADNAKLDSIKAVWRSYFKGASYDQLTNGVWGSREITYPIGKDTKFNASGPVGGPGLLPVSETGDEKSNLVGIIAAKNKFNANGSITFTTDQYFGLTPKTTVAGGQVGQVTILPIGGGIGWVGPSNAIRENSFPMWGSTENDRYNSFGTTALHLRIFDDWPDEQTIYDGRYFSVFHFNPVWKPVDNVEKNDFTEIVLKDSGVSVSNWTKPSGVGILTGVPYERYVDKEVTKVDFRIPTYGNPMGSSDNTPVPTGITVDRNGTSNNQLLRPVSEWRINPVRRGRLLTGGGFRYYKRVIGLDSSNKLTMQAGTGFTVNQEISLAKNVKLKVLSLSENGGISNFFLSSMGDGFLPSDFNTTWVDESDVQHYGYILNVTANQGGTLAKFLFTKGIVYDKVYTDLGPVERTVGPTLLTKSSQQGADVAEGTLITNISLAGNTSNKFDAFYFFHNDILHTVTDRYAAFIPGFAQHVTLNISAG